MAGPTVLSLFSGVGGLELGIRLVFPQAVVLGYVEWDAYAASTLLARMEDTSLERAPVWCGGIQELDTSGLRGRVDLVCGGFPCQDISLAGRGVGIGGERSGLFYELMRVVREVEPRYVFLENVSAITSRGLDAVLGELAESGFDADWICLRASDVGAPHRRDRWFCLAHRNLDGSELERSGWLLDGGRAAQRDDVDGCGQDVAHRDESGPQGRSLSERGCGGERTTGESCRELVNATEQGREGRAEGRLLRSVTSERREVFPPGPGDRHAWERILVGAPWLAPAVEPGVCVLVDGVAVPVDASRADQLRCCGNGVVPLQAAAALTELLRRIE